MGRRAREFTLEAFVIGDAYMSLRDALLYAVEQPGPGLLIHPYRGRFKVAVTECRYTESSEFGGMAKFSLTFVESFDNTQPDVSADTPALIASAATAANAAVVDDFARKFSTAGFPSFVVNAALANVNAALGAIRGAILVGFADMNFLPGLIGELNSLEGNVELLIGLPADLGGRISNQISALIDIFSPEDAYAATASLAGFGTSFDSVQATTPSNIQQGNNQAAIVELVTGIALAESAVASSQVDFASRNDAQSMLDVLMSRFDEVMQAAPDAVFDAFAQLRAAVVRDITARGADLAKVVNYTPRSTLPALVVAHLLYGDATRADEIVARNRIRHPGFVPGGREIEVLA